jgi:septal ring-binding cell division protein DamX
LTLRRERCVSVRVACALQKTAPRQPASWPSAVVPAAAADAAHAAALPNACVAAAATPTPTSSRDPATPDAAAPHCCAARRATRTHRARVYTIQLRVCSSPPCPWGVAHEHTRLEVCRPLVAPSHRHTQ